VLEVVSRRARLVRAAFALYGAGVYLFVFAPIAVLVLFSFNANPSGAFPITGLTTKWYREMFNDYELQDAFWASLDVAVQVTVVSVLIGTAAAFPLARARMRFRNAVRIGVTLPIMLPGLLIGISLLVLFTTVLDLSLSRRTAVIGQSIFTTPFVILLVAARLQTLDRRVEWAAGDLGADTLRRLRYVVLPALLPALVASAVLAFTLSFDEFIITLFLIGGDQTLPLYIFTHVRYGITPEVNAVASLFLLGSFAALTLALACSTALRSAPRASRGRRRRARPPRTGGSRPRRSGRASPLRR
jgi:ABC-type spermidine/putrescine transport system permease subunit II